MARIIIEDIGATFGESLFSFYPNDNNDDGRQDISYSGVYKDDYMFVLPDGTLEAAPMDAMDAEYERLQNEFLNPSDFIDDTIGEPGLENIPSDACAEDGYSEPANSANRKAEEYKRDSVNDEYADDADAGSHYAFSRPSPDKYAHLVDRVFTQPSISQRLQSERTVKTSNIEVSLNEPESDVNEVIEDRRSLEDRLADLNPQPSTKSTETIIGKTVNTGGGIFGTLDHNRLKARGNPVNPENVDLHTGTKYTPGDMLAATVNQKQQAEDNGPLEERVNNIEGELNEMRELLQPEVSMALEQIVNALADSVTQRSIAVTRTFQKMLSAMIRVYNVGGTTFTLGGVMVQPEHYAMWSAQELADIFARLCVDYDMTKRLNMRNDPEIEKLRKAVMDAADKDAAHQQKHRILERQIDNLRKSRNGGLTAEETADIQGQLAEKVATIKTLTEKLQGYVTTPQEMFVLYCVEMDAYLSINREKKSVTFTNTMDAAGGGMTMFPSLDMLKNAMPIVAQWTASEITASKTLPTKEKGVVEFTIVPMTIVYRSGKSYKVKQSNGRISMGLATEVEAMPVKETVTPKVKNLDLEAHVHVPVKPVVAPTAEADEFAQFDKKPVVSARMAIAQRTTRIEKADDVTLTHATVEEAEELDMDTPVERVPRVQRASTVTPKKVFTRRPLAEDDEPTVENDFTSPEPAAVRSNVVKFGGRRPITPPASTSFKRRR